jgi:hypothetical protein
MHFQNLPAEILQLLLSYVDPFSQARLAAVNKQMRRLTMDDSNWLNHSLALTKNNYKSEISKYKNKFQLYFKVLVKYSDLLGLFVSDYPFYTGGLYRIRFSTEEELDYVLICEKVGCPKSNIGEFVEFSLDQRILISNEATDSPTYAGLFGISLNGVFCLRRKPHECSVSFLRGTALPERCTTHIHSSCENCEHAALNYSNNGFDE